MGVEGSGARGSSSRGRRRRNYRSSILLTSRRYRGSHRRRRRRWSAALVQGSVRRDGDDDEPYSSAGRDTYWIPSESVWFFSTTLRSTMPKPARWALLLSACAFAARAAAARSVRGQRSSAHTAWAIFICASIVVKCVRTTCAEKPCHASSSAQPLQLVQAAAYYDPPPDACRHNA